MVKQFYWNRTRKHPQKSVKFIGIVVLCRTRCVYTFGNRDFANLISIKRPRNVSFGPCNGHKFSVFRVK